MKRRSQEKQKRSKAHPYTAKERSKEITLGHSHRPTSPFFIPRGPSTCGCSEN